VATGSVTTSFSNLLSETEAASDISKPYPFYLAYAIEEDITAMGDITDWQAE
jgi:DNA ligase-1